MKTNCSPTLAQRQSGGRRGFLQVDLVVGLAILSLAIVPMGFAFAHERQLLRIEYQRCVANEIVDGEAEILAASHWDNVPDGSQFYTVSTQAAAHLPPGHFQLTKTGKQLRLAWLPEARRGLSAVVREINIK